MIDFTEFRNIIGQIVHIPVEEIQQDSSFKDDLGIDSLLMVNLLVELSEKSGLELEVLTHTEDFVTVGKLFETIRRGK